MSRRIEAYNKQLDLVDKLEAEGRVYCIRPQRPMEVGRLEQDTAKLEALYQEGFALGEAFIKEHSDSLSLFMPSEEEK